MSHPARLPKFESVLHDGWYDTVSETQIKREIFLIELGKSRYRDADARSITKQASRNTQSDKLDRQSSRPTVPQNLAASKQNHTFRVEQTEDGVSSGIERTWLWNLETPRLLESRLFVCRDSRFRKHFVFRRLQSSCGLLYEQQPRQTFEFECASVRG
jgi:hypothetical protein